MSTYPYFASSLWFPDLSFPPDYVKAALVLAFFSVWVLVGVFAYLNRFLRKPYLALWIRSWLVYLVWLVCAIMLETTPETTVLAIIRRSSIGISALFMFWGSFELTGSVRRTRRELAWACLLMLVWSGLGTFWNRGYYWMDVPVFALLGGASLYTAGLHMRLRHRFQGAAMLSLGFLLLGLFLLLRPWTIQASNVIQAVTYIASSLLSAFIAFGMIVQTLEQGREHTDTLVEEFKRAIASRRALEQEAAIAEQKYQALFTSASDAILLVDLETLEIVEANQSSALFLGDNPSDRINRSFLDLCPAAQSDKGRSLLAHKRMIDEIISEGREFQMRRADGALIPCEGSAALVQNSKRTVMQLNIREVTERKKLEQQLRQSEKLGALGQLTAGVAHELNNPLAVIMGYAQLMAKDSEGKTKSDMIKILRESERAAKIVRNLLTFARPRDPQMTNIDLNRLIANILETYEAELQAAGVHVVTQLKPDLPTTVADPVQMEQVLTNCVLNALQAMQETSGERRLCLTTDVVEHRVLITIADTGCGIAPDVITRIFDPFFTTKPPGKGTGLGLSIAHSILREHRGRIWVQSELNHGAKFFIDLPLITRSVEEQLDTDPTPVDERAKPMMAGRLLLVDDEPGILEVMRALFEDNGYTVDTAGNGKQALLQIQDHRYDLIISDLCMPEVDGERLYREIKSQDTELASRIIFVTGDTVSAKSRTFLERTGNRWFSKPFDIVELEQVVANFTRASAHPAQT